MRVGGIVRNHQGLELGISVNGVLAVVDGDQFVANHIPLEEGENIITVTAVDVDGNTESDSITVYVEETGDYARVTADPESGTPPFETILTIEASFIAADASLSYDGPAGAEYVEGPNVNQFMVSMAEEGLYHFAVEVLDEQGNLYTDTVTLKVLDLLELDALLKAKWDGMKRALIEGDIQGALNYHYEGLRHKYEAIYNLIGAGLASKVAEMQDIELIFATGERAKYRISRNHHIQGQMISITYYIYFSKDGRGLWQIERY